MGTLFDTRYYRVTKVFCSVMGLWPFQSLPGKRIIQCFNIFILFSYFPPQLKRLYNVWGTDIDAVYMCMPPILTIGACLSKYMTIVLYESEMKMLLRQIEKDWETISEEGEYKILINYTSKTRILCIGYAVMLCNLLLLFIMLPAVSPLLDIISPRNETRVRSLAFDLDYGIDQNIYWFWLWLHNCMTSASAILNIVGSDLIYVTFIVYSCCLFAIVRYKLEHVTDSIKENTKQCFVNTDYSTACYAYEHEDQRLKLEKQISGLRECVISHEKAIKCAQLLHYMYTWSLFLTLGFNLTSISISGAQLVSKMFQWSGMTMSAIYIMGQLTHLFFLSFMAQFILDHSANVHESAYSCYWYNMPTTIRQDVVLILLRSHSPCKLIAGKLVVMSLESFCSIIQTAMSYFAVLASFR